VWRTSFDLPSLGLANSQAVVGVSVAQTRAEQAETRGVSSNRDIISAADIDRAAALFYSIAAVDTDSDAAVSLAALGGVLSELGRRVGPADLDALALDLGLELDQKLAFPEVVDLASFMTGSMMNGSGSY
jgi:hypothetical protein